MNDNATTHDPFADFDEERSSAPAPEATRQSTSSHGNGGNYADNLFSEKIKTRNRTFFLDLKRSVNGKFLKISELSRGKKSTIIMDAEDIPGFLEALSKIHSEL
jgi:hypothetical protein